MSSFQAKFRMMKMNKSLQNLVLFKAGWLACVFLAAVGKPALATLAVAAVVAIHLYRSPGPVKESAFLLCAGLIGLTWETFMVQAGLIEYPASSATGGWAPYWIVAMWVLFATTVNHGFSWLKRHWMLTVVFGLVGGPMAFLGGAAMGAAQFSNTAVSITVIGIGW